MSVKTIGVISLLVAAMPTPAFAGECDGALVDGTREEKRWSENYVLNQLKYNWLSQDASGASDSSVGGSLKIPIKAGQIGGTYSEARRRAYQQSLQRLNYERLDTNFTGEYLISSGDRGILDAWLGCMQKRTGLVAYFERANEREAVLVLKWINGNDTRQPVQTRLRETVSLPPFASFRRTTGAAPCWQKPTSFWGRMFPGDAGLITQNACQIIIDFDQKHPDKLKSFSVAINGIEGSTNAYLAPRTRFVELRESISIELTSEGLMGGNTRGYSGTRPARWHLPKDLYDKGWRIDPSTFDPSGSEGVPTTGQDPHHTHRCYAIERNKETGAPKNVRFGDGHIIADVKILNQRTGHTLACRYFGNIDIFQIKVVPT